MSFSKKSRAAAYLTAASLVLSLSFVACGKKPTSTTEEPAAPTAAPAEGGTAEAPAAPAAAGKGTIKGKVAFTGTAPDMPDLKREADPFCAKTPMKDQEVVVSNGALQNVAVTITKGASAGAAPASSVQTKVDQVNCMYAPRTQTAVFGQKVEIHNSDPVLHNVHTYADSKTIFNRAQPKGSPSIDKEFSKEDGSVIKFKCDVHPWMTGWLVLSDNGFNAVTGESGEFELKDVPAGTYTLQAWHEKYGPKTVEVTVEADKTAEANFSFDGSEKVAYQFKEVDISPLFGHDHSH